MSSQTREAILYGQYVRMEPMKSPNVSSALAYRELCVTAKGEEHRLSELKNGDSTTNKKLGRQPTIILAISQVVIQPTNLMEAALPLRLQRSVIIVVNPVILSSNILQEGIKKD